MTKKLNLNQSPYFDDYKASDKYYQILFRPGRAVQARELTQLQTLLQNQIERFGTHIFKQGSNVIPGTANSVRYARNVHFIKLPLVNVYPEYNPSTSTSSDIETAINEIWIGKKIRVSAGDRQGLTATILGYRGPDNINGGEVRLFVNIITGSTNGLYSSFAKGDTIQIVNDGTNTRVLSAQIPSTEGVKKVGTASSVQLQEGVYFYNGYFVYVDAQTLYIAPEADDTADDALHQESWNDMPTATVGLLMSESIKTFQDDTDLLDNALGSPNYSAPGADRFHIEATLTQIDYDPTASKPDNFISLVEVVGGQVLFIADAPDYSTIVDTLARRTHDESGDYVVEGLNIELKEFLRDDTTKNNGAHNITEFQFTTAQDAAAYSLKKFGVNSSCSVEVAGVEIFYPGSSYDERGDATSFKALCDSLLTLRIDSGKAYVKGYEIRKIAKSNVDVPKSRTTRFVDQKTIETELGRYLLVTDVVGNITFPKFVDVDLYDARRVGSNPTGTPKQYTYANANNPIATKVGTATLISIQPDSQEGAGFYRAYLTNIKLTGTNSFSNVKTIHAASEDIFAHVHILTQNLAGSLVSSGGTTTGTGTKWKNDASQVLKLNDYIFVDSTQEYYRVSATPTSDTSITLKSEDGTNPTIPTGSSFSIAYTQLESATTESGLLYKLGDNYVSSVRTTSDSANATQNQYTIDEYFNNLSVDQTTKKIVKSVTNTDSHTFVPNEYTYKVIQIDGATKTVMSVASGESSPAVSGVVNVSSNITNKTLTFSFADADAGANIRYDIVVPVIKTNILERKKTLQFGSFDESGNYTHSANGDSFTPTTQNPGKGVKVVDASNNSEIHLSDCDVFRVTRIIASKDDDTQPSTTLTLNDGDVDVTALYRFDNGQTEYEYRPGVVHLQASYKKLSGKVRVEYDYFDHDGDGDFFTVNSYTHDDGIKYDEIPVFKSSDGADYPLSDCLDFRQKVSVNGVAQEKSGRAPKGYLTCDYFAYNGRKDKVILDSKTKTFTLSKGVPDAEPVDADDIDSGMTLVELTNNPYGIGKNSCLLKVKDNRRYTMRDIGKLERRIENLEYYTALSLLEQETARMSVTDANGNDRFKNGFLADSFNSFESCDVDSPDFTCSVDTTQEQAARPLVTSDNFKLEEDLLNPIFATTIDTLRLAQGTNNGYQKVGELYMLPFTRSEFISQPLATKVVSVNPYEILTYVGQIDLTPWSDEWRETRYSEIQVFDDSAYQSAQKLVTGDVNYGAAINSVVDGPKSAAKRTGKRLMLKGGHVHYDKMTPKQQSETRRTGKFRVPKGYLNEGQLVDINIRGGAEVQYQTRQTYTQTATSVRTGLQNQLVKTNVTTAKALTKDETTEIEFMRSREVKFAGKAFRPYSNLYTFFDDVPVSVYCRPVAVYDTDNWFTCGVTDITNTSGEVSILPIDSPVRYFRVVGGTQGTSTTFNVPSSTATAEQKIGTVRVGCEVQFTTSAGITRKFDIERISPDNKVIVCREKTQEGLLASQAGALVQSGDITIKISKYAYGDQLKASGNGSVAGVFKIPNEDGLRFKTGESKFVLSSSSQNAQRGLGISRAAVDYVARGILNTQEMTITQTQNFVVTSNLVNDSSVDANAIPIYDFEPPEIIDPIAQTFRVTENGGCYITDVDVFFANKPSDNSIPVRLELRPVSLTGIPEATIVGGNLGTIIKTADQIVVNKVDIQTNTSSRNNKLTILVDSGVDASEVGGIFDSSLNKIKWSSDALVKSDRIKSDATNSEEIIANVEITSSDMSSDMIPTRFTFKSPIYLEQGKSYAFVLLSDSSDYEVWVAQSGQYGPKDQNLEYGYYSQVGDTNVKIGTTDQVTNKQLYFNGGFFKSKNGLEWELDSTVSIKFNIAKAKFKTRAETIPNVGEITYVNETVSWTGLTSNALEVRPNSKLIRVLCPNHGTSIGDRVRFSIDSTSSTDVGLRGFLKDVLQNVSGLKVVNAEVDYFTVETTESSSPAVGYKADASLTKEQYRMCPHTSDGKATAFIRIDKRFDNLTLITNTFCPVGTSVQWVIQTTPAVGVNEYNSDGSLVERLDTIKTSPLNVVSNVPVDFSVPMKLQSPENEPAQNVDSATGWAAKRLALQTRKSAIVRALLVSDNENLSPVIDKTRLSATTLSTRLDNPRGVDGVLGNNINLTGAAGDFDTLTVLDKDATAFAELEFTNSTVVLTGTFNQDTNSKTVTSSSLSPATLLSQVSPGDKIVDVTNPQEERTVVKVINNTKMVLNAPFNAPLDESSLALVGEYMQISTEDETVAQKLSQLDSGKYVSLIFSDADEEDLTLNTDTRQFVNKLVLNVFYTPNETVKCKIVVQHLNDGTTNSDAEGVTITQLDRFVDEIAYEGGSCASKYVCKKLNLDRPSNALKITFDGVRDEYSELELYYRTEQPNDKLSIYDKNWTKATYNIDVNGVLTPKTPEPSDAVYRSYETTIEGLQGFNGVQAKVVMRGGNPAKPPKIKNFRLIALDE